MKSELDAELVEQRGDSAPWLTTWSGEDIPPVADYGKRQGQLPLRRLFT